MTGQSRTARLRRLAAGACPVHGLHLGQLGLHRGACPRRDCDVTAVLVGTPWVFELDVPFDALPDGWPEGGAVSLPEEPRREAARRGQKAADLFHTLDWARTADAPADVVARLEEAHEEAVEQLAPRREVRHFLEQVKDEKGDG